MGIIVDLIDEIISNIEDESVISAVGEKVVKIMKSYPLFSM
jgi:glycine hydroxymethyltransferase